MPQSLTFQILSGTVSRADVHFSNYPFPRRHKMHTHSRRDLNRITTGMEIVMSVFQRQRKRFHFNLSPRRSNFHWHVPTTIPLLLLQERNKCYMAPERELVPYLCHSFWVSLFLNYELLRRKFVENRAKAVLAGDLNEYGPKPEPSQK